MNLLELEGGARNVIPLIVHVKRFLYLQKHLTSGTELILIGCKIVPSEEHVQCDRHFALQTPCKRTLPFVTTFRHKAARLHYVGPELRYIVRHFTNW